MQIIKEVPSISRAALSKKLNISERQVRKIIDRLKEDGVLTRQGGNSGSWVVDKE
ncbi:MAG: winged helix-turn-helix transcriptional regulator [Bacteroidales bacterium]|nr:winged helix-turn-helix transcriptional regulator [Bacteroidales bacterium]